MTGDLRLRCELAGVLQGIDLGRSGVECAWLPEHQAQWASVDECGDRGLRIKVVSRVGKDCFLPQVCSFLIKRSILEVEIFQLGALASAGDN